MCIRDRTKSSLRTLPLIGSFREYFMQVKEAQELNKQVCGNCYNYESVSYTHLAFRPFSIRNRR